MALQNNEHPFVVAADVVQRGYARINAYYSAIDDLLATNNPKYKDFIDNYSKNIDDLLKQTAAAEKIIETTSKNLKSDSGRAKNKFQEDLLKRNVNGEYDNLKKTRDSIPTNNEDIKKTNALLIAVTEGMITKDAASEYASSPMRLQQLTEVVQDHLNQIRNTAVSQNTNNKAASSSTTEQHTQQISHTNRAISNPQNESVKTTTETTNQSKASSSTVDAETPQAANISPKPKNEFPRNINDNDSNHLKAEKEQQERNEFRAKRIQIAKDPEYRKKMLERLNINLNTTNQEAITQPEATAKNTNQQTNTQPETATGSTNQKNKNRRFNNLRNLFTHSTKFLSNKKKTNSKHGFIVHSVKKISSDIDVSNLYSAPKNASADTKQSTGENISPRNTTPSISEERIKLLRPAKKLRRDLANNGFTRQNEAYNRITDATVIDGKQKVPVNSNPNKTINNLQRTTSVHSI
ncbi:hypothetical protein SAMN05660668_02426 [Pseudobutyrivibrio sp. AR14]|uniref:hypothetical protein n=1 Tax=Pseudobutyrivibrio sp. AR14 TaxID=1520804 RepID=UPI00088379AE|nr:hypothetical protein [Pseudobutyrivibrio sp. AR14]SCY38019.1 hypothetical protein SAMN05660668_02426 [Pseudobutyrivibrio sp. AR14]